MMKTNNNNLGNRQIRWALFRNIISQFGGYVSTVYKAVPSRDLTMTETTYFLLSLFCNTLRELGDL